MKIDRGIIKWAPFNSVTPSKQLINKLANERQKINKPILSEEQLETIQNNLLTVYNNEIIATIKYFKNGSIYTEKSQIKFLDPNQHRIILTNNKAIYFNQIIKVMY